MQQYRFVQNPYCHFVYGNLEYVHFGKETMRQELDRYTGQNNDYQSHDIEGRLYE